MKVYRLQWNHRTHGPITADYARTEQRAKRIESIKVNDPCGFESIILSELNRDMPVLVKDAK